MACPKFSLWGHFPVPTSFMLCGHRLYYFSTTLLSPFPGKLWFPSCFIIPNSPYDWFFLQDCLLSHHYCRPHVFRTVVLAGGSQTLGTSTELKTKQCLDSWGWETTPSQWMSFSILDRRGCWVVLREPDLDTMKPRRWHFPSGMSFLRIQERRFEQFGHPITCL